MAVLILSKVNGQTQEGYDAVLAAVEEPLKKAAGFIMHYAYSEEGEWNVAEMWNSKQEADEWFKQFVAPNLPKGVYPKRTYRELYSLVIAEERNSNAASLF
jgi:sugar (pentulose or hexulose) kinase